MVNRFTDIYCALGGDEIIINGLVPCVSRIYATIALALYDTDMLSHDSDVIMKAMASQISGVSFVCSNVYSDADRRKHQNSASLAL